MEKMKIAVIGCGKIANDAHLKPLSAMPDVEIKYAADLIPERAEAACRNFGAKKALVDYKIALADSEVSAVYVLTPNFSHYTITMDALRAGKHVFCENPSPSVVPSQRKWRTKPKNRTRSSMSESATGTINPLNLSKNMLKRAGLAIFTKFTVHSAITAAFPALAAPLPPWRNPAAVC
ncbi:MAG: Gfo/Idh/MocA family oxidoreductase [Treponema sp.]|nr:Gfo/Idh/MocA family oxidoreductase [Treponema sp.]